MSSRCCVKPIATIIKVKTSEAGIIGLEAALRDIYISGIIEEEQLKAALLEKVKKFGNHITPGTEVSYREAILGEYRKYMTTLRQKVDEPNI